MSSVPRSAEAPRGRGARLAAARLALRRAEESTGLHRDGEPGSQQPVGAGCSPGLPGLWAYLGSCPAGVVTLQGSAAVLLAAAALRQGSYGWCGILGGERLGWCAAAELGLDLSRVLHVPSGGLDPSGLLAAAGALLDGVDVLLLGARPAGSLGPAGRRRVLVRARGRGALVLSPVPWEGARTLVCEPSCLDDGAPGARDGVPDEGDEGVVVPLRPREAPQGLPQEARGTGTPPTPHPGHHEATEIPAGYLRGISWTLSDLDRGLGGTVLTHGPHGLRVREPAPAADAPASPAPLRGAG